eukprot:scaffold89584_cov51-Attheya_sp.AAC.2
MEPVTRSVRRRRHASLSLVSVFMFSILGRRSVVCASFVAPSSSNNLFALRQASNSGSQTSSSSSNSNNNEPLNEDRQSPFVSQNVYSDVPSAMGSSMEKSMSGYKRPAVQWYPGHIAKAERMLSETLKSVDVVIEVRDARAPKATAHPQVAEWSAGRPRIVVLTKVDLVPKWSQISWQASFDKFGAGKWDRSVNAQITNQALQALSERSKHVPQKQSNKDDTTAVNQVEQVLFMDAKRGQGIHGIHRAIIKAGSHINERRMKRGLNERPLRVGIIGYPNVGKSALINKILGRKRAKTANTPGITRSLQWIRVRTSDFNTKRGKEFELLDSPGIIPANMVDQSDALLLAACNNIGNAAYDNQGVASYLCEWLKTLYLMGKGEMTAPQWRAKFLSRYGLDPLKPRPLDDDDEDAAKGPQYWTGEDMLYWVADHTCNGDPENAARKILQDFRAGRMGPIALQLAPQQDDDNGQIQVPIQEPGFVSVAEALDGGDPGSYQKEREARAAAAMATARERGLELPPLMTGSGNDDTSTASTEEETVGKGMFDGW